MRVLLLFFSKWIFTRNTLANIIRKHLRQNSRSLPKISWHLEEPLTPSASVCVFLYAVPTLDCVTLRGICMGSLPCSSVLPSVALCVPLSSCSVTANSLFSSASATPPCNSPSKIKFYSFRIDLLRVLSVCSAYFPNDPQVFFYNLLVDESTTQIRSLINGWD